MSTQAYGCNLPQAVQVSAVQMDPAPTVLRDLGSVPMCHVFVVLKGVNRPRTEHENYGELRALDSPRRGMADTGYRRRTDQVTD